MIVLIGLLVGIYIFGHSRYIFHECGNVLVWMMMEVHNQYTEKVDWTSYIISCPVGVAHGYLFLKLNW